MAKPENNLIIYRDEYFKKGSAGLQEFLSKKIGNSCNLVAAIDAAPKYLRRITRAIGESGKLQTADAGEF